MVALKGTRSGSWFFMLAILIFVALGDRFLPEPVGSYSYKARSAVENFLKGNFFLPEAIDNPHRRTESEVENLESR